MWITGQDAANIPEGAAIRVLRAKEVGPRLVGANRVPGAPSLAAPARNPEFPRSAPIRPLPIVLVSSSWPYLLRIWYTALVACDDLIH